MKMKMAMELDMVNAFLLFTPRIVILARMGDGWALVTETKGVHCEEYRGCVPNGFVSNQCQLCVCG